ncbi:MAG TPA: hypothetical protein PKG90_02640 [Chitinophagaceae bacterium]|nr:hypothetical protein [Chitinophagaceae bacterium]
MLFSQRIGITSSKKAIQLDSIDVELRNGLWNIFRHSFLEKIGKLHGRTEDLYASELYFISFWHNFLKSKIEDIPYHYSDAIKNMRELFYSPLWYRPYDIIDFTYSEIGSKKYEQYAHIDIDNLTSAFNIVLEREFSAYRIINHRITPISNELEINEITDAINSIGNFTPLSVCNEHLTSALEKLSDRNNPDYRNSIKESISAVEAVAKIISGSDKDTLGSAIDKIKGKLKIHSSLEKAIKNIYGYTSDSNGIRHALTEENNLDFEDAKYMLVSCSSFINYLIVKADKSGIKF